MCAPTGSTKQIAGASSFRPYRILFAVQPFYYPLQNSINPACWYRTNILGKICIFFLIFNRYSFVS